MRRLAQLTLASVGAATLVAVTGDAAEAKKPVPTVTKVAPMRVKAGGTLTIRGRNFSTSKKGNTVIVEGWKGRRVIVKPSRVARNTLVIKLPSSTERILTVKNGGLAPTRVHLRVVTKVYGARSALRQSPVVVGARASSAKDTQIVPPSVGRSSFSQPSSGSVPGPCGVGADWDGDLLDNATELTYGLNPCSPDSDGDGLSDGWEFWSAKDLNVAAVPYPGKKPYPNPLDSNDGNYDFDGDSLPAYAEFRAWVHTGREYDPANPYSRLGYSDGTKTSRPTQVPAQPAFRSSLYGQVYVAPSYPAVYDTDGNGQYSDDERDADADGLTNFIEQSGPGHASWWTAVLARLAVEPWPGANPSVSYSYYGVFNARPFADLDLANPDVDGDNLLDGEDDQDNDGFPNTTEMYNPLGTVTVKGQAKQKNAFNPCAPDGGTADRSDTGSRTCPTYFPVG